MKKIPAAAFKGCKNLATIKCNAKLSSVSKSAFKGCKKKIKITGKSKKANKKKISFSYISISWCRGNTIQKYIYNFYANL